MNNKLTIWYQIDKANEIKSAIKEALQQNYGYADTDFKPIENGIKFLFDDETNGEIEITYVNEQDCLKVTVAGTWSWEVIEIYRHILPNNEEELPDLIQS